jgi:hypothetical protein
VFDATLKVTSSSQTLKELQNVSTGSVLLATFQAGNPNAIAVTPGFYSASVNWEDGHTESSSSSANVTVVISGTTIEVFGTHTYATGSTSASQFTPAVTLSDSVNAGDATTATTTTFHVATDKTASASFTKTAPTYYTGATNASQGYYHNQYRSTLTIKNTSNAAIGGSLMIALTGLKGNSPNVTLSHALVTVGGHLYDLNITLDSAGDPVIYIPSSIVSSLNAGASLTVTLWFTESVASFVTYTPKIYSDPYDN